MASSQYETDSQLSLEEVEPSRVNSCKKSLKEYNSDFHEFITLIVKSFVFNCFIMSVILLDIIIITMETTTLWDSTPLLFITIEKLFLGIYLMEFILRIYGEPLAYWRNYYNVFDCAILFMFLIQNLLLSLNLGQTGVTLLKVVQTLRALRMMRFISFIQGLQVIVSAFIQTIKSSVIYLLFLLLTFMFLFALMGYYLFGYDNTGDQRNWGSFGRCLLSLFTFVTVDGWSVLQQELTSRGYKGSEIFTVVFIFLGHFIFTNLFIGVVITNIHYATNKFKAQKNEEKRALIQSKKEAMIDKQHKDVMEMLKKQHENNFVNLQEMTVEFEKSLRHDDFTYTTDLCTTVQWMETMAASLKHLEHSKHRCHQIQFELAELLAEMKEQQLNHTNS